MRLVREEVLILFGLVWVWWLSDGRRPGRGESVARGQHDERGVVEVRVAPCSSEESEELEHQEKGETGNRPGPWIPSLSISVRKIKANKTLNTLSD